MALTGCDTDGRQVLVSQGSEHGDIDRFFEHFFSHSNLFNLIPQSLWSPPTDVYETPHKYVIKIEIPGIKDVKDFEIGLNHNVLTVRGCRRDKSADTKLGFDQMEIHYGYFEKVVTLPHSIDPDTRSGEYRDGFLCITIGKAEPRRSERRKIEIQA